jgi:hypothetical protein
MLLSEGASPAAAIDGLAEMIRRMQQIPGGSVYSFRLWPRGGVVPTWLAVAGGTVGGCAALGQPSRFRPGLKAILHSNFIERTFGETHRRVKVPGEASCLKTRLGRLDRAAWAGAGGALPATPPANCKTSAASCSTRPTRSDPATRRTPARPWKMSEPSPNIHTEGTEPRHLRRSWDAASARPFR